MRRWRWVLMLVGSGLPLFLQADEQILFSFVRPLDVVQVSTEDAWFPELTAETTPEGAILRRLSFNNAAQPTLSLEPQDGVWDWTGQRTMTLRLRNAMEWDLTLHVRIESGDGQALEARIGLPTGPTQTLAVPLQATSPETWGMRAGPPMPWSQGGRRLLVATQVQGEISLDRVRAVKVYLRNPDVPQHILLGQFGVSASDELVTAYQGLVDGYGQYTRRAWGDKINADSQLRRLLDNASAALDSWNRQLPERDRFGGLRGGARFEATGFFRTEKQAERWYLVTPDGHPFFSLGVNAVSRQHSQTYVQGREVMFQSLPAPHEPLALFYGQGDSRTGVMATRERQFAHGRWFDFYSANRYRAQAEQACERHEPCAPCRTRQSLPDAERRDETACLVLRTQAVNALWPEQTLARLQAWGFNTLGNWSDAELHEQPRMPYVLPLSIAGDYASIPTGHDWWGAMPDPFDPRFAMAAERAVAIAARGRREDPWLIGYFVDNELPWAAPGDTPQARYALAYNTLRQTTDVPAKRAFLKQLRDRYRNQQGLAAAWGIELPAWELMEDPGFEAPLPDPAHPAIEDDLRRFLALYADTYFRTVAEALAWHAPNHLLLGGRFSIATPEALAACARYCDVLSLNTYTRAPQQGQDFAALRAQDKPLLISEFSFGSRDRGPFWPGPLEVPGETARGAAYAHFLERALQEPVIVGLHWFQYLDQPVTGRLLDGENGHVGLVAITDVPFDGFVDAVRRANLRLLRRWLPPAERTAP